MRVTSKWRMLYGGICNGTNRIILVAAIIFGTLYFTGYLSDKKTAKDIDKKNPLSENQVRRLIVDFLANQLIVQEQGKKTKVYTGIRKAEFTELRGGAIKMHIPTKGFTFEPGLTIGAADGLRIGGDIQYAYWRRWGLLGGATVPATQRSFNRLRLHAGFSYSPYWKWMSGTSGYVAIDTNKKPLIGLRTRF